MHLVVTATVFKEWETTGWCRGIWASEMISGTARFGSPASMQCSVESKGSMVLLLICT